MISNVEQDVISDNNYKEKYLNYKSKYLKLKQTIKDNEGILVVNSNINNDTSENNYSPLINFETDEQRTNDRYRIELTELQHKYNELNNQMEITLQNKNQIETDYNNLKNRLLIEKTTNTSSVLNAADNVNIIPLTESNNGSIIHDRSILRIEKRGRKKIKEPKLKLIGIQKRGRPRLIRNDNAEHDNNIIIKGKRGRPRLIRIENAEHDNNIITKGKRGRPRLIKLDQTNSNNEDDLYNFGDNSNNNIITSTKKRGRPRLIRNDNTEHGNNIIITKGKRGRPRLKVDSNTTTTNNNAVDDDIYSLCSEVDPDIMRDVQNLPKF